MIRRRSVLAGLAAAPLAQTPRTLRFVPQADLGSLDPIWTTADITRHHAFLIYDTLFGLDADFQPRPQMAAGYQVEDDGLSCTITLRSDLAFHDGAQVTARDAVASLKRWMQRNSGGQSIAENTDEFFALDDLRLRFRLKRPQPRLIDLLASIKAPVAFIMPEHVARADAFTQVHDTVGSGPFRFRADEFLAGNRAVYERNDACRPSPDTGRGLTADPKVAHFDRVEWRIIPDAGTAAAALRAGEVDWYEAPSPDLLGLLRADARLAIEPMDFRPAPALLRFNHLHPPFADMALRQAVLPALDQADFVIAAAGDAPASFVANCGFFTPGTPLANTAGLEALAAPRNLETARAGGGARGTARAGPQPDRLPRLGRDLPRRGRPALAHGPRGGGRVGGLEHCGPVPREPRASGQRRLVDLPDRGQLAGLRRPGRPFRAARQRSRRVAGLAGEPAAGGAARRLVRGAPDLDAQRAVTREMQAVAFDEMPYLPVGAYLSRTALRRDLRDRVVGFPIFWGIAPG